ncbi:MAG TPA: hypothetical protein VGS07_06055 [Thermoanaerobaculia bacterium]|jgi:hypothetical protein|nr:hypothetical protein [Thermoanaerobaculia bacterium]
MPRKRQAETRGSWMLFAKAFTPELVESHIYLKATYAKLNHFIQEVERLGLERDFHAASKLEATRQRKKMIAAGSRLVTAMQLTLRDHLGPDNEQLTAFGIKPFRGRKHAKKNAAAETPSPVPVDPSES